MSRLPLWQSWSTGILTWRALAGWHALAGLVSIQTDPVVTEEFTFMCSQSSASKLGVLASKHRTGWQSEVGAASCHCLWRILLQYDRIREQQMCGASVRWGVFQHKEAQLARKYSSVPMLGSEVTPRVCAGLHEASGTPVTAQSPCLQPQLGRYPRENSHTHPPGAT